MAPTDLGATLSNRRMTTFTLATNEYGSDGKEKAEYHAIVGWD